MSSSSELGQRGFSAAITAAELGAQVALIGGGTIGGTCVNVGCVPSKALIRAVEIVHQTSTAKRSGGIIVDDRMRTTCRNVYAAGDVTGRDQFVYMASYGAKLAARNALNNDSLKYDNSAMPAVVFTDPQVASVGLTEAAARVEGYDVRTSVLPLSYVPRALAARDTRGLIKLVADGKTPAAAGRAHSRAGRCRQHPDGGFRHSSASYGRRSRGGNFPVSNHC